MSQESLVLIVGFIILLVPYLGIPNAYDQWLLGALGAILAVIGYRLRRAAYLRSIMTPHGDRRNDAFVESPAPVQVGTVERGA